MELKQEKLLPRSDTCKVQKKIHFWETKQEGEKDKLKLG